MLHITCFTTCKIGKRANQNHVCMNKLLLYSMSFTHCRTDMLFKDGNSYIDWLVWIWVEFWWSTQKKYLTRGPRGPWVAYLRKRSKVTVEPIIENPRGIIWTTLIEDLLMMLYIKYESTGSCSFRQDFLKFHFKNLFIDPVTYLCNQLEQFEQLW